MIEDRDNPWLEDRKDDDEDDDLNMGTGGVRIWPRTPSGSPGDRVEPVKEEEMVSV